MDSRYPRGKFIVFEGIDGSGKSTQALRVCEALRSRLDLQVLHTREPGGTTFGERLREILLDPRFRISHHAEILAIYAARMEHINKVIRPAIETGTWVICERFTDSTYAYQGHGRGMDLDDIELLETFCIGPDITILLDVSVSAALNRCSTRDRIEQNSFDFFNRVQLGFHQRAQANPKQYAIIDGMESIDVITENILHVIRMRRHKHVDTLTHNKYS